ncbi:MAG: HD domain-containing protein [Lachnospiraceae bacterium]|nr:HD domain-containing protein [Lachnospiraceae bacterium]
MSEIKQKKYSIKYQILKMLILCVIGIAINLGGSFLVNMFDWPIYLDSVGTVLIAVMSGYLPGIIVGLVTNLIKGLFDTPEVYYAVVNVLIAVIASAFARKGWFRKPWGIVLLILSLGIVGGGHGTVLKWIIQDAWSGNITIGRSFINEFVKGLMDKSITVVIVLILYLFLPYKIQKIMQFEGWQQTPPTGELLKKIRNSNKQRNSLRNKMLWLLVLAGLSVGVAALVISVVLYRQYTIDEHFRLADGTTKLVASIIDGNKIDQYIAEGDSSEEYRQVEARLYDVFYSSPDIEYLYVYQIKEDGCHVVFDLDTAELEGGSPGDVIPFDESFEPMVSTLLIGGEIEPIITNDTYGWLITVYKPVYNDYGKCTCYAATDISMNLIRTNEFSFMAKLISIFAGFFILIIAIGLWITDYNVVLPINTMSLSASEFAYKSEEDLEANFERINKLNIRTGDEIETMYHAFSDTTEKNKNYVYELNKKTETISEMQNALILVLADMVENRDENTGDHVRKTAAYTRIIMDKMLELGYYKDQLTEDFIYDVEHSAPLHDIGKITVSDTILNKNGKLTDKEFEKMKSHTTAGADVLQQVIDTIPESSYLQEAKNLAEFHHEKWNGKGYPAGLSGEDIPLSARIMAVADVFDALVSARVYKPPFSFEKAMDIIKGDAGTHFDPLVADAFFRSQDEVRAVMEHFHAIQEMKDVKKREEEALKKAEEEAAEDAEQNKEDKEAEKPAGNEVKPEEKLPENEGKEAEKPAE